MPRTIRPLVLPGPAGNIEARLEDPEQGQPRQLALVCHPHPLYGVGETEDARACLRWLLDSHPGLPYTLAGFSFGALVILRLGCQLDSAARVIAAGYPTRAGDLPGLLTCPAPKIFIQSTHDQYGPRQELEPLFARLREPKRLLWVEAADHFFAGALDEFEQTVFSLEKVEKGSA